MDYKAEKQEDGSTKYTFNGEEGISLEEFRERFMVQREGKPNVYDFVMPKEED